ncbi:MAG TPA: cysteine desulfurase DndA [Pyrinomonadaceae bacterium]|jgi:cysteine desulfurase
MPIYLDCNATSPIEPKVGEEVIRYLKIEFGNAGSRTHEYGARANQAVQRARDQVAEVVSASREEVVFTSGATESNNLVVLGLAEFGEKTGHKHIVSTAIEHKAVLEPLEALSKRGFEVTLLPPTSEGWVDPDSVSNALRDDTLLVSIMHANNETGVVQPLTEIADGLASHSAYFHVDAAQGFGKDIKTLQNPRIDFISVSGHKIYGPKGIGALITRRRGYKRAPLSPLLFGGGQERGLRPGTLPVPLIVGLGLAAELALKNHSKREKACRALRDRALKALSPLSPLINGEEARTLPHVLNLSFPGLDSEAVMVALKDLVAVSNGSACTSHSYQPSHVLKAMGLSTERIEGAIRISWCHMTEEIDWSGVAKIVKSLR